MRNFSKDEKEILSQIVSPFNNHTISARMQNRIDVMDLFDKVGKIIEAKLEFDKGNKNAYLITTIAKVIIKEEKFIGSLTYKGEIFHQAWEAQYWTVLILSLLEYLEKNHLVYTYNLPNSTVNVLLANKD